MLQKPWSHLPTGSKKQRSIFFNPQLMTFLLMLTTFFTTATAQAETLPTHQLTVGFDLAGGRIFGTSEITVPANQGINIELGDLSVSTLNLDNEAFPIPAERGVTLAPLDRQRTITIFFEKVVPTTSQEASDNLIGKEGISLTGFWHPQLVAPCRFELIADVPTPFTAISEADQITEEPGNNSRRFHFHIDQPITTRHLIAGDYVMQETPFADNKKLVTYFFKEDQKLASTYRDKAASYLKRYQKLIDQFPYQRFSVVENRLPTGYAMPSFTLLGQSVVRLPFITDTSLGHEILHQWFGNAVETEYTNGNWAEGFTTYLADHAFAEDKGEARDFRRSQLVKYQSFVPQDNDIALKNFVGGASHLADNQQQNRAVGYSKGAMLFHMLRKKLGDEAFNNGVREFYRQMRFRVAGWADLQKSFESASQVELGDFFAQWLDRADLPELKIRELKLLEKDGRPELNFTIIQQTEKPYRLTVPVMVGIKNKQTTTSIEIADKETKVSLPFDDPPTELVVDGEHDLMRRLSLEEMAPVWSRFAGAANKVAIVADGTAREKFAPLLPILEKMGCVIKNDSEATDKDVSGASAIFLGPSSLSRSLFANPSYPATGFTVDVRHNPLDFNQVAVLATADTINEVQAAAHKLRHYGKYGYLHFENGRAVNKKEPEAEHGLAYYVDQPPKAISLVQTQSFDEIVDKLLTNRVIYVGEGHTTYEDHLLQLRIIRAIYKRDPKLAIGMEMFNHSAQAALDDYVAGKIDENQMLSRTEYFTRWGYDYRLYSDIIRFAHRFKIPIIALNQQKEVVSKVFKDSGTAGLSEDEQKMLPDDRDLDIPGYRDRIHAVFNVHAAPSPEQFKGFIQAQALWDETMAANVAEFITANPDKRMVVIAGVGHVTKTQAIPPRVTRRIKVKQAVVANINSTDPDPEQLDFAFLLEPARLPPAPMLGVLLKDKDGAVLVDNLSPHGKAKEAGIRQQDIIVAIDDQPTNSISDLKIIMLGKKKGESAKVTVKRKRAILSDKTMNIDVPL